MTRDQDIERVLDQWLTEGPTQMPSRFLDDTLDRIDRAPQHRLARLQTRLLAMYPNLRFAATAAIIVATVLLGAAVLTRTGDIGSSPAGPTLLPASLQSGWLSVGTRVVPGPGPGGTNTYSLGILIDPTTIDIQNFHTDVVNSARLVAPDRFEIRAITMGDFWHCAVGDVGLYTFSLTAGDQHLTLTPAGDACAERVAVLTGDWTRTDIGDLTPGRHVSRIFRPFGGGTNGQFSYTVPSGWAEVDESNTALSLGVPRDGWAQFTLLSDVVPQAQDGACPASSAGVGPSPDAMAESLATLPGAVVTTPTPVMVGGLRGVMVDLSVAPGSTVTCDAFAFPGGGSPRVEMIGEARVRYIILDSGDGRMLLIDMEADDKATWDEFVADAMPVIDSFEFAR